MHATALIAEDEPLLAANLQAELMRRWPDLEIVACVGDGASALERSLDAQPDIVFLDIRMPGMSGLDAAQALIEDWPDTGRPMPLLVFVTAFDEYAVDAFERAALDYVLKPVQPERLARTCERLQNALRARARTVGSGMDTALEPMIDRLRGLLGTADRTAGAASAVEPLRMIQASAGNTITMIAIDEVIYFEAADKYVRVMTEDREHLIRTPLRELLPRLDPARFWQIHRGTIVRADAIASASRDETGKLTLSLRRHPAKLAVSRLYMDRFKAL
ncbi:LytR/AlgR family response regulator transcription factor [Pararobbsia silviterrae]|uniref:DNA-binding response regulator n=1 Tax=Pararobbsia silviterrae TaxID=1792498 RepID=A0A494Y7D2_9BURK|nr:LytTR family DNA-binding domain-containing protein [Pararobbsia silviterrae]RKP58611.1 DNA-binding response regulator [Pararobbsia silviterrae]